MTAITPGYENARRERRELMRQGRQAINGALAPSVDPTAEPSFDPITTIQFPNLPEKEPPPRWFVWAGWLPAGCLSAVYGAGGIGKTLLAQQLATHVAIGRPFLGADVARSPVLALFAEDDDEELKRRQRRINQALGLKFADLGDLHIQGRAGLENVICTFARGAPDISPFFDIIISRARELKAGLIILDNRAQMLLCDENDRAAATYSGNLCACLARETGAAVLLIGHVAKAEKSEFSGSTAWDAVVRSRWFLHRAEAEKDQPPELALKRVKSNYSGSEAVRMIWRDGALLAVDDAHASEESRMTRALRQREAVQAFLDLLDQLKIQGRPVSHSERAQNYAPKMMVGMNDTYSRREYAVAMETLFSEGRIRANAEVVRGADRKWKKGIVRAGAAGRSE